MCSVPRTASARLWASPLARRSARCGTSPIGNSVPWDSTRVRSVVDRETEKYPKGTYGADIFAAVFQKPGNIVLVFAGGAIRARLAIGYEFALRMRRSKQCNQGIVFFAIL